MSERESMSKHKFYLSDIRSLLNPPLIMLTSALSFSINALIRS